MGDMRDVFDTMREQHKKRVTKNPQRLEYAISQLEQNNIEYEVKNAYTGHIHARSKSDNKLFQFYAGTGKIQGYDQTRGIHAFIKLLLK